MIEVVSVYNDVLKDNVNTSQNGDISIEMFNRMSKRAELRLIDYLTGGITGLDVPQMYVSQKSKDWLSPFISKHTVQVVGGVFEKPKDYYLYENLYKIGSKIKHDCDDDEEEHEDQDNTLIELLDGDEFNDRKSTFIEELKVDHSSPIAKEIGLTFEVAPKDIGSVCLEYLRFPKYASIIPVNDPVYNIEVPGSVVNYEWDERAREMLVWIITDTIANHTREEASKKFNESSKQK